MEDVIKNKIRFIKDTEIKYRKSILSYNPSNDIRTLYELEIKELEDQIIKLENKLSW